MPKSDKNKLGLRLIKTTIDQFAVFESNNVASDVDFNFDSKLKFDFDNENLLLYCSSSVVAKKNDNLMVTAAATFVYEFEHNSVEECKNKENNTLCIPQDLLVFLGSKTYGALRGILLAKLEQTSIRLVLPLTDLSTIITQSLTVDLEPSH